MDIYSGFMDDRWAPQVQRCSYFSNVGRDGPSDCRGQIQTAQSFRVTRGSVRFWQRYENHPAHPIEIRYFIPLMASTHDHRNGFRGHY